MGGARNDRELRAIGSQKVTSHYRKYRIQLSPAHLTGRELDRVRELIDTNWLAPSGPEVDAFEDEFKAKTGVENAVALTSGTAALHLALHLLGLKSGDAVACPTFTFVASANPIRYVGATPVFIDCDDASWTIDPVLLGEALSTQPEIRALVAVDVYGQCCDYDSLREVCVKHGVTLIQDAAESLGSTHGGVAAGKQGDLAAFSFNGNKIMTTGGGGMLVSSDGGLIDRAKRLSMQARAPGKSPHFEHDELGFNYRLSSLLAALGRAQLEELEDRVGKRRAVRARYQRLLEGVPGITFMPEPQYGEGNAWLTCIIVDRASFGASRDDVWAALDDASIESRPLWKPMHLQPLYRGCRVYGGGLSERLFKDGLCLPSGSGLTPREQDEVAAMIVSARKRRNLPRLISSGRG